MRIIKEVRPKGVQNRLVSSTPQADGSFLEVFDDVKLSNLCVIRSNSYGKSLQKLKLFEAEAKKDFPFLKDVDIEVRVFGGDRVKGIVGIEFTVPDDQVIPNDYQEISEPHMLMA